MEQTNPTNGTKVREVVAGLKVVETEYKVQRPVFKDVEILNPILVEKQVEKPVGIEKVLVELADEIAERVFKILDEKLAKAIDARVKEIEVPEIIYKKQEKIVEVEKPVYRDVDVERPKFVDREIANPILVNKEIINPVIKDVEVINAVLKDKVIVNPIFEDVVIQKPKYVDKTVHAIHIKYVDPKGNPDSEEELK